MESGEVVVVVSLGTDNASIEVGWIVWNRDEWKQHTATTINFSIVIFWQGRGRRRRREEESDIILNRIAFRSFLFSLSEEFFEIKEMVGCAQGCYVDLTVIRILEAGSYE